jgi:hypothetical protein
MYKTIRLALLITPSERTAVAETAKAAGGVFQGAGAELRLQCSPTSSCTCKLAHRQ